MYTASLNKYADPLIDMLDPSHYVRSRLFRPQCIFYRGDPITTTTTTVTTTTTFFRTRRRLGRAFVSLIFRHAREPKKVRDEPNDAGCGPPKQRRRGKEEPTSESESKSESKRERAREKVAPWSARSGRAASLRAPPARESGTKARRRRRRGNVFGLQPRAIDGAIRSVPFSCVHMCCRERNRERTPSVASSADHHSLLGL